MNIATLLENLINKKFYKTKEEIEKKLDIFYAMDKINDTEYSELTLKVREVYESTVEETSNELTEEDKLVENTEEREE